MRAGRTRGLTGAAAAAAIAVTLAACGGSDSGGGGGGGTGSSDSSSPYRVLALLAQSGPAGTVGAAEGQAAQAAVAAINDQGGIDGRKLELTVEDTQANANTAVTKLQSALSGSNKPDLVIAGTSSDETLAICPVTSRAKILSVSITSAEEVGDPKVCGYQFTTSMSAAGNITLIAKYLKSRGLTKVALLTDTGAYSTAMADEAKAQFPKAGLQVVASADFAPTALDLTSQWKKLRGSGADVVFVETQSAAAGPALDGRTKVGWDVPVLLGPGAVGTNVATLVNSDASLKDVTFFISTTSIKGADPQPERSAKINPYFERFNGNKWPVARNLYANTFDTLAIIQTAAKVAHSSDPDVLRKTLEGFGTTPPAEATWLSRPAYAYSADSHFPLPSAYGAADPAPLDDKGLFPPYSGAGGSEVDTGN
jgi:branched-chain amino acid transport system substrate-binding protein